MTNSPITSVGAADERQHQIGQRRDRAAGGGTRRSPGGRRAGRRAGPRARPAAATASSRDLATSTPLTRTIRSPGSRAGLGRRIDRAHLPVVAGGDRLEAERLEGLELCCEASRAQDRQTGSGREEQEGGRRAQAQRSDIESRAFPSVEIALSMPSGHVPDVRISGLSGRVYVDRASGNLEPFMKLDSRARARAPGRKAGSGWRGGLGKRRARGGRFRSGRRRRSRGGAGSLRIDVRVEERGAAGDPHADLHRPVRGEVPDGARVLADDQLEPLHLGRRVRRRSSRRLAVPARALVEDAGRRGRRRSTCARRWCRCWTRSSRLRSRSGGGWPTETPPPPPATLAETFATMPGESRWLSEAWTSGKRSPGTRKMPSLRAKKLSLKYIRTVSSSSR